jgi:hypothetical protein
MNNPQFGTPAHMLRRNEDPETSHDSADQVDTTHLEKMVYHAISGFPQTTGAIQDDILQLFPGKPYSSVTARFKGLTQKHLIYYYGDKRKGRSNRQQRIIRIERREVHRGE